MSEHGMGCVRGTLRPRRPGPQGPEHRACPLPTGLLLLVSLEVFRHSVRALLQRVSPEPPPAPALAYEYSWSLGCGVGAVLVLLLGGGCFLLLTLPPWPWGSLCPKQGPRAA